MAAVATPKLPPHTERNAPQAVTTSVVNPADVLPWLPCELTLEIPVARFTIGELLTLRRGTIVETACHHTNDIPLRVNGQLIGWTEFEVVGDRLAVRITELA
jgi:flagellar motor switch/type III secretory pathway protein FliN